LATGSEQHAAAKTLADIKWPHLDFMKGAPTAFHTALNLQ